MGLQVKIGFLNAENLFILGSPEWTGLPKDLTEKEWKKAGASFEPNKPLSKIRTLAKVFEDLDLDLVILCEVGGKESLKNFNNWFLNGHYDPFIIEGNSDRNIDLGVLKRKSAQFEVQIKSHRNRPIPILYPHEKQSLETGYGHLHPEIGKRKFSRDVLQLDLTREGVLGARLLAVHLKSKREVLHLDPLSQGRRQAELQALVDIYRELIRKEQVPTIVLGDFNGKASGPDYEEEFKALHEQSDLVDVMDLVNVHQEDRWTFVTRSWRKVHLVTLDYAFMASRWKSKLESAFIYRYPGPPDFLSSPGRAQTLKEAWPSDHTPIVLHLKDLWVGGTEV